MKRVFDPAVIKGQIANLQADRERINQAIQALEAALRNMEAVEGVQNSFEFPPSEADLKVSLHDAVKKVCIGMVDGITRQRVVRAIEAAYPFMRPKSASIAASLINLSRGDEPLLKLALEGSGRTPAVYSTQGEIRIKLSSDEIEALMDETAIRGTGGWQSLWVALRKHFDKASGVITLLPELRARIYNYYHFYGVGGWQSRVKRVFRRELPHLFVAG
jgi:hypothetical protein